MVPLSKQEHNEMQANYNKILVKLGSPPTTRVAAQMPEYTFWEIYGDDITRWLQTAGIIALIGITVIAIMPESKT